MSDLQVRGNKIDTDQEYKTEVQESLDDMVELGKSSHFSLSPSAARLLVGAFSDEELIKALHELSRYSPEDLEGFTNRLDKLVNKSNIREIALSIALNGTVPDKYLSEELKQYLFAEVFRNDPPEIQALNEIEMTFQINGIRYKFQEILVRTLPQNQHSKYDLNFYNLNVSEEEKELMVKQQAAATTPSKFDDYMLEFKLGMVRRYEPEEQAYLAKRMMYYAKVENRVISNDILKEIEEAFDNQEQFDRLGLEITKDSKDKYSFHQLKLMGSNYNFAFFGSNPEETEFHETPKLDDRPIIILLHGLTQTWGCWREMINILKDKYQILAPDMNGFGDSSELVLFHNLSNYTAYISNFIKHMGITSYDVAGHSFGSFTVQEILDTPIRKPNHAIMISSAPKIKLSYITYGLVNMLKASQMDEFFINKVFKNLMVSFGKIKKLFGKNGSDDLIRRYNKTSVRTMSELLDTLLIGYSLSGKKIKVSSKCLVVAGVKDSVVLPDTTKELLKVFENTKLIEVPNSDHSEVLVNLPAKYEKEVMEFLNS